MERDDDLWPIFLRFSDRTIVFCYARFTVESVPLERVFPFRYTEIQRFLLEFKVSGIIRIRETPLSPLCNFITHAAHYVDYYYEHRILCQGNT